MRILTLLVICALLGRPAAAQEVSASGATIQLSVQSFIGDPLVDATVDLIETGTKTRVGQAFTVAGDRVVARDVPYGEYVLQVRRPGFRHHDQRLNVYQPRVSLRVYLRIAQFGDRDPTEVIGTVAPVPPKETKLWVKLLPLLTTEFIGEAEVELDGTFRISGLDEGQYILVLMRGTDVIQMKQVRLYRTLRISLVLPSAAPFE